MGTHGVSISGVERAAAGRGTGVRIRTNAVMTGLVPVIHVVKPPEKLRIGRKRRRVDGRDKILWGRPRGLLSFGCRPHGMERSDD
jgi:hypothetical protein